MGAHLEAREGRFPPLHRRRDRARRASSTSCRWPSAQVKSCVLIAGMLAAGSTTVDRAVGQPRPHRAPAPARARAVRARRALDDRLAGGRARAGRDRGAGRSLVGGLHRRGGHARARLAGGGRGTGPQLDPHRLLPHRRADGRGDPRRPRGAGHRDRRRAGGRARRGLRARSRAPRSSPTRCRWRSTSSRWWRCSARYAEGETVVRGAAGAAASRSPTGSPAWWRGCAAWGRTSRRPTTASWSAATARRCAGGTIDSHGRPPPGDARRRGGLASAEGVEVVGMDAAARLLSRLRGRPARRCWRTNLVAWSWPSTGPPEPARAPWRARRRGRSASPTSTPGAMYRAVGLHDPARRRSRLRAGRRRSDSSWATAWWSNGEDVTEAIRAPEVSEAASRVATNPRVRAALVAKQRELLAQGDWVAEGRDIGTVVAPDAAREGLPHRRAPRSARAGGRPSSAPTSSTVLRDQALRDAQDSSREHSPLARGARGRRARHHRAQRSTRWWPASSSWSRRADEAADGGRGRLPERRQVHARQPPVAAPARPWCTSRPGVTRDRKEVDADWNGLGVHARRHRRRGLRRRATRWPRRSAGRR